MQRLVTSIGDRPAMVIEGTIRRGERAEIYTVSRIDRTGASGSFCWTRKRGQLVCSRRPAHGGVYLSLPYSANDDILSRNPQFIS